MIGRNGSRHDFKNTKIHPTVDDIKGEKVCELTPNLIDESYENSDHYFKTQFNLLREESVRPLVDAVNKLKDLLSKEKENIENDCQTKGDRKTKFRESVEKEIETNVYFDIKLEKPFVDFDVYFGPVLKFTFDYKSLEKIDLIDCQHLMNGGILCLSSDGFVNSLLFGIIVKSQLKTIDPESNQRLWNFCLKLDLDDNEPNNFYEFLLKPNNTYIGVESPSFFEGFRHSLKRLQNMSKNFPFNRYLIKTKQNTDLKAPPYLSKDTIYDLSCIKKSNEVDSDPKPNVLSCVQLLESDVFGNEDIYCERSKPLKNCSTFDTKQFDAFYSALTKELCIIEGPPGTGKTFVGLKIVECLLKNSESSAIGSELGPILIVCYKNHSLDQFLEGIIKFNQNVVRIGGQSESEELKPYGLRKIEDNFYERLKQQSALKLMTTQQMENMENPFTPLDPKLLTQFRKFQKLQRRIKSIKHCIEGLTQKIEQAHQEILDPEDLQPYIKPKKLSEYFCCHQNSLNDWLNSENDHKFQEICEKKLNKKKFSDEAFDEVYTLVQKNVLELTSKEKWLLYLYWRQQLLKHIQKELKTQFSAISEEMEKIIPKKVKFQRMLCKSTQIIGLTVTGAAKYSSLVEAFKPKIMIVEEAAEVLEGHVVAALSSTIEHLILIGDHKQLRPLTNVRQLTDEYNLDFSLFERLVSNGMPFVQLELQHRMRPSICELLKVGQIYDNLRNGEKVQNYPNIEYTFNKNMFFLNHNHIEDNNFCREVPDKSRCNLHEAQLVVEFVKYLLLRNYPENEITVLTTYNAQLSLIRKLMLDQKDVFCKPIVKPSVPKRIRSNQDSSGQTQTQTQKEDEELRVRISSVDGYQGEENNIIIISFVRSSKRNAIGFLGNKNRVNVALSRAKHALYCIGNFNIMAKEIDMWSRIVEHLKSRNNCFGDQLIIGCECTQQLAISMPGQLSLLNLQIKNGRCKCANKSIKTT